MVAFQIKHRCVRDSNHLSAIYVKYMSLKEVMNVISLRLGRLLGCEVQL